MSLVTYTYTLTNGTLADADQVMDNFNKVSAVLNGAVDNTNVTLSTNWVWTGTHTFSAGNVKIKGAGTGVASLQYANSSNNRTITFPDPGADSTLVALAGAQTITGAKTFSGADTLLVPTTSPSAGNGSIAFNNRNLHAYSSDASAVVDFPPIQFGPQGLSNIAFAQGSDSSQLKITSANGTALGATNPGYVRIRSSTAGTYRTYTVTADVTLDLTGAHWGLDTKGNVSNAILRVYAIDDGGTLRWGVGYCGGFYYIRNSQDDTTASNINLPEEIFVDSNVTNDNSPIRDVGYIIASFTDASNEWAIGEYHPNESADGIWQPWSITFTGFSANPTTTQARWTQVGKTTFISWQKNANGTSNATTFTVILPIKSQDVRIAAVSGGGTDNGAAFGTMVTGQTTASSTTLSLFKDGSGAVWTNVNAKGGHVTGQYETYQP